MFLFDELMQNIPTKLLFCIHRTVIDPSCFILMRLLSMFRSTGLYLQILFFLKEINNRASLLQYRDELTREREREREREDLTGLQDHYMLV
jgi:hypothetical protein